MTDLARRKSELNGKKIKKIWNLPPASGPGRERKKKKIKKTKKC
jgi:hypothetical protein